MSISSKYIINVMDEVNGTSTNAEGYSLFVLMDKAISKNQTIVLSLKACSPMSSSFLNSSIGALIEKHGIAAMKGKLTITDYTPAMAQNIKQYLDSFKRLAC